MKSPCAILVLALTGCVPITEHRETEQQLESCLVKLDLSKYHLVEAPKAATGVETADTALVVVTDEKVAVNGDVLEDPDVSGRFAEIHDENPDTRLLIDAKPDVPYGKVLVLLDQARMAGFTEYRLGVGPQMAPLPTDD